MNERSLALGAAGILGLWLLSAKDTPTTEEPSPLPPAPEPPPVDAWAELERAAHCDIAPKPGTIALRDLVLATWGGTDVGISRECKGNPTSEHQEGRAWDWAPPSPEVADDFLAWLLAPEGAEAAAWARRLGVMYVIWQRRMWRSYGPERNTWGEYAGASPHEDHVHISLSWPGARAETSGYDSAGIEVAGNDTNKYVFLWWWDGTAWSSRGVQWQKAAMARDLLTAAGKFSGKAVVEVQLGEWHNSKWSLGKRIRGDAWAIARQI